MEEPLTPGGLLPSPFLPSTSPTTSSETSETSTQPDRSSSPPQLRSLSLESEDSVAELTSISPEAKYLDSRSSSEFSVVDLDHLCGWSRRNRLEQLRSYRDAAENPSVHSRIELAITQSAEVQDLYGSKAKILVSLLTACRYTEAMPYLYERTLTQLREEGRTPRRFQPNRRSRTEIHLRSQWGAHLNRLGDRHPGSADNLEVTYEWPLAIAAPVGTGPRLRCDISLYSNIRSNHSVMIGEVKNSADDDIQSQVNSVEASTRVGATEGPGLEGPSTPGVPVLRAVGTDIFTYQHYYQCRSYLIALAQQRYRLCPTHDRVRVTILALYGGKARALTLTTDQADLGNSLSSKWPPRWPTDGPCGTIAVSPEMDPGTVEGALAFEACFSAIVDEAILRYGLGSTTTQLRLQPNETLPPLEGCVPWEEQTLETVGSARSFWIAPRPPPRLRSPPPPSDLDYTPDGKRKPPSLPRSKGKRNRSSSSDAQTSDREAGSQTSVCRKLPREPPSFLEKFRNQGPSEFGRILRLRNLGYRAGQARRDSKR